MTREEALNAAEVAILDDARKSIIVSIADAILAAHAQGASEEREACAVRVEQLSHLFSAGSLANGALIEAAAEIRAAARPLAPESPTQAAKSSVREEKR